MARYELKIPKLGESVIEATITTWLKNVGDTIAVDDGVLEVATDKVDTEIPSEVGGKLIEILVPVNEVAKIGQTVAIIETDAVIETFTDLAEPQIEETPVIPEPVENTAPVTEPTLPNREENVAEQSAPILNSGERYYSPLVKNIAEKERISQTELDNITGTGLNQRVTKEDVLNYLQDRQSNPDQATTKTQNTESKPGVSSTSAILKDEIIPMDRMGKLIADHMVKSVQTSAHVQSFIEIDVTRIVQWRTKHKESFLKKTGENLTFTPIFMQAVAQTIREYPLVNISVDGDKIIKKKDINLGMAAALPDGNLIVPVIKNADELNLLGMAKAVNRLAENARKNKLSPDDIQGGTYTVTNVGSFGSITGTPIINQPQVAILALGAIRKMPAVMESPEGDYITIRHKMIVAHSYDHRVINGALGGMFILKLKELLENFTEPTY